MRVTRRRLLVERNSHTAVYALPIELLAEIFLLAHAGTSDRHEDDGFDFLRTITSVSSAWRHAAIDTSALWTTVAYVAQKAMTARACSASCERLKAFLSRSKDASLDFHVELAASETMKDGRQNKRVLDIIFPHLPRCRTLFVRYKSRSDISDYIPLKGPLDRLEEVTLGAYLPSGTIQLFEPDVTPPLHRFRITGQVQVPLSSIPTPLLDSVHIESWGISLDQAIDFASRCKAAREIHLNIPAWYPISTPPKDFSLPNLKCLKINDELSLSLIRHLSIPNIESLSIVCPYWRTHEDLPVTPVLPHTLRILSLVGFADDPRFAPATLVPLFQTHAFITTLYVETCRGHFGVILALLGILHHMPSTDFPEATAPIPDPQGPLLPRLTMLQFRRSSTIRCPTLNPFLVRLLDASPTLRVMFEPQSFVGNFSALVKRYGERITMLPGPSL